MVEVMGTKFLVSFLTLLVKDTHFNADCGDV